MSRCLERRDFSKLIREYSTPVEMAIPEELTLKEAIECLRRTPTSQKVVYFYVVDESSCLKGIVSTRQLLLSDPQTKISEIMQKKVVRVRDSQTLREALELFHRHPLLAFPVVDVGEKLIGVLDVQTVTEEMIDFANVESRSSIFQMIGLTLEDERKVPLRITYSRRMPWLLCNVGSGLVCALISLFYEEVLGKHLLLAFFIPLVLTLSESSSMQSMAQSLQFLRRPRLVWRSILKRGLQEERLIIWLAVSSAILVGGLSLLWKEGIAPSIVIGVGILFSIFLSASFGVLIPIVLHRFRLDPKVAAGPVVLMIADVVTTAIYLSLATWWLL